jgi:spermidine/putrescine transport system ATP-binding protein
MSDKVVVMNQGYIQQMGTPEQIYNEPENAFVADFIGDSNIVDGTMVEDYVVKINGYKFPCIDSGFGKNKPVDVVIRPEDIEIGKPGQGIIDGVVTSNVFIGVHYEMCIEAGGIEWLAQNTRSFAVGQQVSIGVAPENIQIMNKPQSEDEEAISLEDVLGDESEGTPEEL